MTVASISAVLKNFSFASKFCMKFPRWETRNWPCALYISMALGEGAVADDTAAL